MPYEPSTYQAGFAQTYTGHAPWEIGRPQPPFVAVAGQLVSPILEAGCGTGNAALFFAAGGHQVTAIDFVEEPIRQARAKAAERGLSVEFLVKDAMTLAAWDRRFSSAIDSGLYHIYPTAERRDYLRGLAHVLEPGGRLFLLSFSDKDPNHKKGLSLQELQDDFADGWHIESVAPVLGELNPAFMAEHPNAFPDGSLKMWFAVIRRDEAAK
jgi:ubiquinone/menaquinone biosynthesis C-methylase UbiE